MSLGNLLNVLDSELKLSVVEVRDNIKTELIRLFSGGQAQLTTELLEREVDHITILGKSSIEIRLTTS